MSHILSDKERLALQRRRAQSTDPAEVEEIDKRLYLGTRPPLIEGARGTEPKPLAYRPKRPAITPEETEARLRALGVPEENIRRHLQGLASARAPKAPRQVIDESDAKKYTVTADTRARISAAKKGRKLSEATKAKMSAVRKGRPHSLNHRLAIAAGLKRSFPNGRYPIEAVNANTGAKRSEEAKARMREAALGRRADAETKAKLSAISKARWADETYRAKHAAGMTPEARHAMGKRWRGHTMGDVTKALISAGLKRAYAEGRRP